jgi:hypothetical protein
MPTKAYGGEPYKFPEDVNSMTIHLGILEGPKEYPDVDAYFAEKKFALAADLLGSGLNPEQIEAAVNAGRVIAAHWPAREPKTDFFWGNNLDAIGPLTGLAFQAVSACYGQDKDAPIGGDFISVGAEMGSQQLAIAALIYAREQGTLREVPEFDRGGGPFYIVRDSFAGHMLEQALPEAAS